MSDKDRAEMKANILAAKPAMHRLITLLESDLSGAKRESKSKDKYSLASWPYLQADLIGTQRALERVIELIKNA